MVFLIPEPLLYGTIVYGALTLIAVLFGVCAGMRGIMDKENASVFTLLSLITGLCLWIFWACAWLHQWHLLVYPTYDKDAE